MLNDRQEKYLLRIFKEGAGGFAGGLSAENDISITKSTRPTATRDLADLVSKGALTKKGEQITQVFFEYMRSSIVILRELALSKSEMRAGRMGPREANRVGS